jgi:hypothetical protein
VGFFLSSELYLILAPSFSILKPTRRGSAANAFGMIKVGPPPPCFALEEEAPVTLDG